MNAPCTKCPRLAACVSHHEGACADLRRWRESDPARELADLWAAVLPGEPADQTCG